MRLAKYAHRLALGHKRFPPRRCWLSHQESEVFHALMRRKRPISTLDLTEVLWPDPDQMPDTGEQCVRATINRIRHVLKRIRSRWRIVNVYRIGYRLEVA